MTPTAPVRETVSRLLAAGRLEKVPPAAQLADRLISGARAHVAAARVIRTDDPPGSLQLAYDASRKAATSLLAVLGLRATARGGHLAVQEVVVSLGTEFAAFARLRRRRHEVEYPGPTTATATPADAREGIEAAAGMVQAASLLLASGGLERAIT